MADVGVLNLQIQDNSEKAVAGLDSLVGALNRVKSAIEGGIKLSSIATGLRNLGKAIDDSIHGSTIVKLGQLADELSKLKGLGNINIKINGGSSIESIMDAIKEAQADMSGINTGFDEIGARAYDASGGIGGFNNTVRETEQLMQSTAWGNGIEQFRELLEQMSRLRMAFSLPAGAQTGITTEVETGFQMMKEGAIEVEGTVTDAMGNIVPRLGEPIKYLTGMASQLGNINDYLEHTNGLMDDLARKSATSPTEAKSIILYDGGKSEIEETLENVQTQAHETVESLNEVRNAAKEAFDDKDYSYNNWGKTPPKQMFNVDSEREAIDYVDQLISRSSQVDLLNMKIEALRDKLVEGVNSGKMTGDQIARTVERIRSLQSEMENASKAGSGFKSMLDSIKTGIGNLGIVKLAHQFANIAKSRILRTVIKHINAGFQEGVQNVYNYSKAVGTSLAPSMDNAASSLDQFKNSIGAAVSPLITALVPALQTVVNWLIEGINYLNQFFSLLNGQSTWTKALYKQSEAYKDTTKNAKSAGGAIKDLLADWDELNIIQSNSGGGGSGAGANTTDYSSMFEEIGEYDEWIKQLVDGIEDTFGSIWNLAKKIGVAILSWRFSKAFTGVLGTLGALIAAGEVLSISWKLTEMFDKKFLETGEDGWLVADAVTNLVGATLAGGIIGKVLSGAMGIVTAGIELVVSGGISYGIGLANEESDKAQALKDLGVIKGIIGDVLMAAGFGIVAGPAGILLGAAVGGAMFTVSSAVEVLVQQWNSAKEIANQAFAKTGEGGIDLDKIFEALNEKMTELSSGYTLTIKAFEGAGQLKTDLSDAFATIANLTEVVRGNGKLTQEEADAFKQAWTTVFDSFAGLTAKSFDTIFTGLNESLRSENETLKTEAQKARASMLSISENITNAEAAFRVEQEELAAKVSAGKATKEETEQYFKNLDLIAKRTRTAAVDLEEVLKGGENIDFGDQENAVARAVQFVNDTAAAAKEATEEIKTGYQTLVEATDEAWSSVELYHEHGDIDNDVYKEYEEVFKTMRKTFEETANDNATKVAETSESAVRKVIEQAFSGLANIPGLIKENGKIDPILAAAYINDVIFPILEAAQDAGFEFSEDFGKMFAMGVNFDEYINQGLGTKLVEYLKETFIEASKKNSMSEGDIGEIMQNLFPRSNADLLNRKVIELEDGAIQTLYSTTYSATKSGIDSLKWNQDVVLTLTPITPDGKRLTDDRLNYYVEKLLEKSTNLDELFANDKIDNGGKGLLLDATVDFSSIEEGIEKANDLAKRLSELQGQFYEDVKPDMSVIESLSDYAQRVIKIMDEEIGYAEDSDDIRDAIKFVLNEYGKDAFEEALPYIAFDADFLKNEFKQIYEDLLEQGYGDLGSLSKGRMLAGAGMSDSWNKGGMNYINKQNVAGTQEAETIDYNQMEGSVRNGATSANAGVIDELQTIAQRLSSLLAKEWKVVVSPSSDWGNHNSRSNDAWSRVNG